jgi:hypothetical protein
MSKKKASTAQRKARSARPHGSALCAICKTPLIRAVEKDLCAHCQDSIPEYIWADCDLKAPPSIRWAFYRSKADQHGNRPDLKVIKLHVSLA